MTEVSRHHAALRHFMEAAKHEMDCCNNFAMRAGVPDAVQDFAIAELRYYRALNELHEFEKEHNLTLTAME